MKAAISSLAVRMVLREKPPELSLGQVSHLMQQGLSVGEIAQQFGVHESVVYRRARMHPNYLELKRVQSEKRAQLTAAAEHAYWKPAAMLLNRGFPVERAYQASGTYERDYRTIESFERAVKSATTKHPHLAFVL